MSLSPAGPADRILIVGAGPVGLTLAIELARRGFQATIIDKSEGPTDESRAFGIHARTLQILEPSGITRKILAEGLRIDRSVFYDRDGPFMRINFSHVKQKFNFAVILPQSKTERILIASLSDLGIGVRWNTELQSLSVNGQKVCAVIDGSRQDFELVLGCDGANSKVRSEMGIAFAGESYPFDWQLVDVAFSQSRPIDEIRIKMLDANLLAYFPLSVHSGRFVLSDSNLMDVVENEVDVTEVLWQSTFRISHRIVETYQKGNVFLAGDAAHIHSPLGGRGMNLGIEDAATLAWLISEGQTDRYTKMRKPIGKRVLRLTHAQTRQVTSPGRLRQFATRRIAPVLMKSKTVQRFVFRTISGSNTPKPPWL